MGSGEASLPGVVEQMQPQFISRFLEGQSGVTIKSVSCGDLFTTCMTGQQAVSSHSCTDGKLFEIKSLFILFPKFSCSVSQRAIGS